MAYNPDSDIKKLKNYAKALGVRVCIYKMKIDPEGVADYDYTATPPRIQIFKMKSKSMLIVALIHELGHHLDWTHRNQHEGYLESLPYYIRHPDLKPTKKQRGSVRKAEYNATLYMDQIHEELQLSIPKWKVYQSMMIDRMIVDCYYETGQFMTVAEIDAAYKTLTPKKVKELRELLYGGT